MNHTVTPTGPMATGLVASIVANKAPLPATDHAPNIPNRPIARTFHSSLYTHYVTARADLLADRSSKRPAIVITMIAGLK
jgi:hypothetical protein